MKLKNVHKNVHNKIEQISYRFTTDRNVYDIKISIWNQTWNRVGAKIVEQIRET